MESVVALEGFGKFAREVCRLQQRRHGLPEIMQFEYPLNSSHLLKALESRDSYSSHHTCIESVAQKIGYSIAIWRMSMNEVVSEGIIESKIHLIRGKKVMLDSDLAELYGVTTGNLHKALKRNLLRFPEDFMFHLSKAEFENLKFQSGRSSWGGQAIWIADCSNSQWPVRVVYRYEVTWVLLKAQTPTRWNCLRDGNRVFVSRLEQNIRMAHSAHFRKQSA